MIGIGLPKAGLTMVFAGILTLSISWYIYSKRNRLAIKWFFYAMISASIWSFSTGLEVFFRNETFSVLMHRFTMISISLAAVTIFLFAVEFITGERTSNYIFCILIAPAIITHILFSFDQTQAIVYSSYQINQYGISNYAYGFWGHFDHHVVGYGLTFGAIILFLTGIITQKKERRLISSILFIAVLIPVIKTGLYIEYTDPFDLTPYAFFVQGLFIIYALRKDNSNEVLDINPFDRKDAFENMNDSIILVDENKNIIDLNKRAEEDFPISSNKSFDIMIEEFSELKSVFGEHKLTDRPVTIEDNRKRKKRYYTCDLSEIEYSNGKTGFAVVLQDITTEKNEKRENMLLKQLYSRFIRHNIRNDLTVVRGRIAAHTDQSTSITHTGDDNVQMAIQKCDKVINQTEKANKINKILDYNENKVLNLTETVEQAVQDIKLEYHNIKIRNNIKNEYIVIANPYVKDAIHEAIENSKIHGKSIKTTVDISIIKRENKISLFIEDNSGGIQENEIKPIQNEKFTDLEHGGGVGLWLMKWIIHKSEGEISFHRTNDGTKVQMDFWSPNNIKE